MPELSVIMSVYKENLDYIRLAIVSILEQSEINFEFIIILDCPERNDVEKLIMNFHDSRLILLKNKKNLGLAKSLNIALDHAKGIYIARMDADDIAKKDRFEKQIKLLKNTDADVVSCRAIFIDDHGNIIGKMKPIRKNNINKKLPIKNVILHPGVMMKKEAVIEVGLYREFPVCQDYDLWLRMLTKKKLILISNVYLMYFRRYSDSISSKNRAKQFVCDHYAKELYKVRENNDEGNDSFSNVELKKRIDYVQESDKSSIDNYITVRNKLRDKISINNILCILKLMLNPMIRILVKEQIQYFFTEI